MIKIYIGKKGTGKTKHLIDEVNKAVLEEAGNVVCITRGNRLMFDINHKARCVDTSEFGNLNCESFMGFICGIISKNFDISHIFIDSVWKITPDVESFEKFLNMIEEISKKFNIKFTMSISEDRDKAPKYMESYIDEI